MSYFGSKTLGKALLQLLFTNPNDDGLRRCTTLELDAVVLPNPWLGVLAAQQEYR